MVMRWMMMWLNWSVATINAMLQLLDIYRFETLISVTFILVGGLGGLS